MLSRCLRSMEESMRLITMGFLSLTTLNAFSAEQFCAAVATEAAKAIANVNGSVSENVISSQSKNGKMYSVVLQEKNVGKDTYSVSTGGGHDCVIYSVKIKGHPTRRP